MPAPQRKRSRTASEQVSAALLQAAETVLDRDGVAGVTVREVAREAGVAPMGVYNRFANKDGLLEALAIRTFDELAAAIEVPTGLDPIQRLLLACRGYRGFALTHPARYSLVFASGSPAAVTSSPARTRGAEVFQTLVAMVRDVSSDTDSDPVEDGQTVWNAVHGAVTIELAGVGQTSDATASFDHMLNMLVRGMISRI